MEEYFDIILNSVFLFLTFLTALVMGIVFFPIWCPIFILSEIKKNRNPITGEKIGY